MEACLVLFIAANLLANQLPMILTAYDIAVTAVLLLILLSLYLCRVKRLLVMMFCSVLLGFCSVSVAYHWHIASDQFSQSNLLAKPVQLKGQLVKYQQQDFERYRQIKFNLLVDEIDEQPVRPKRLVRLSWRQSVEPNLVDQVSSLFLGHTVSIVAKLKPSHGLRNPNTFNYQKWLLAERVVATGYVKKLQVITGKQTGRAALYQTQSELLADNAFAGVLKALATGQRDQLTQADWLVFRATGTAHLMALSGLHIGLVFAWCWLIFRVLLKPVSLLDSNGWLNIHSLSAVFALIAAWSFVWFSGAALPAMRAGIMLSVFVFFYSFRITTSWRFRLLLAVALVMIFDPFASLSLGFWLSFAAVSAILITLHFYQQSIKPEQNWRNQVKQLLYVQLGLLVLLMPVQHHFFAELPVYSLLCNLLVIPWMSVTVIPLSLFALLSSFVSIALADMLYQLADWCFQPVWWWLTYMADLPFALGQFHQLPFWLWLILVILLWLMVLPIKNRWRVTSLMLCASLAFGYQPKQTARLDMLDVGQGLAILISRDGNAVLYDTGAAFSSGFSMVESVILPTLKARGLRLQAVVVSHSDNDHAGGLSVLKTQFPNVPVIGQVAGASPCYSGQQFDWLDASWRVLSPPLQSSVLVTGSDNDLSCVIKLEMAGKQVLLTGDIEKQAEAWLLANSAELTADIATVPHHGSRTSSSLAFIKQVDAQTWLLSRGLYNRFNHPADEVSQRYQQVSAKVLDSAVTGQVSIDLTAEQLGADFAVDWHSPWWMQIINSN